MPQEQMPSPAHLKREHPLSSADLLWIKNTRSEAIDITMGRSSKKLLITGPCSIHDANGALAFALYLKELQELLPDWLVVMRCHLEKPRTSVGWKGFAYDPYPEKSQTPKPGLSLSRDLLIKLIQQRIPLSYELLDPFIYPFFDDCYTLGQIGTRTIRSSIHRQLASLSPFSIGLKNPQDGQMQDVAHAFHSIRSPQEFFGLNQQGFLSYLHTEGNPHQFVILRGTDKGSNFSKQEIRENIALFARYKIDPHFVIDCGHGNSQKSLFTQKMNAIHVLQQMKDPEQKIVGLMIESYLKEGSQTMNEKDPDLSITDPCLGIESLFSLFEEAKERSLLSL